MQNMGKSWERAAIPAWVSEALVSHAQSSEYLAELNRGLQRERLSNLDGWCPQAGRQFKFALGRLLQFYCRSCDTARTRVCQAVPG